MDGQQRKPAPPDAKTVYADIIRREHHISDKRPQMPRSHRAAQFAPYATLKGYDDLVRESARQTDARRQLDESEIEELNAALTLLRQPDDPPEAAFTVFIPDGKKEGGSYTLLTGRVARFDELDRSITLDSGETIPVENIVGIDCEALSRSRES